MTHSTDRTVAGVAFALHARAALEKHLPEARTAGARWGSGANLAWVRYRRDDGLYAYTALRRHLDWVTGEAGLSRAAREFHELPAHATLPGPDVEAFRLRLGEILHEEDRWWPAGATDADLRSPSIASSRCSSTRPPPCAPTAPRAIRRRSRATTTRAATA
ncbi:MAG: hypothetical protein HY076_05770 [Candidatus Eisenbacteria bacterium]|uniref:Uncharacterized protein n=1 Tax=Eiseniibacteriota bacterium TaxID=2212470 RepID=A0A9D6LA85_UNCEI|nr:hypothetical protein [Candidatus Eisenbacteria bacterium]